MKPRCAAGEQEGGDLGQRLACVSDYTFARARAAAALCAVLCASACGGDEAPLPPTGDLLPHPAPAPFGGQVCSSEGYCWYAPLPSATTARALWGTAFDDVWAGGDALLHFDGSGWGMDPFPLAPGEQVRALSGTSKKDVWAGGDRLLHYDGAAWTEQTGLPDGEVFALAASSAGVLAILDSGNGAGERQLIVEKRGSTWTTVLPATAPDLRALWVAPDGGEAWAAGFDLTNFKSRLLHRPSAGKPFAAVDSPGAGALHALWGAGASDLWAAGLGTLLHWDGARWTATSGLDPKAELHALWGSSPTDVYAAQRGGALHYDGTSWKQVLSPAPGENRLFRAAWGSGPRNLWLAGEAGALWQGDKVTFTDESALQLPFLEAVSASGPEDAWAVGGGGTAVRWDGHYWRPSATPVTDPLQAVYAAGPADAWAASAAGDCTGSVIHWNGTRWSQALGPTAGRCYTGLSGTSGSDVWAVAPGVLLHWDGTKWQSAGPADPAYAVYAAAPGEVFALQDSTQGGPNQPGGIWHLKNGAWSQAQVKAAQSLHALWGAGPGDVWAAGDDATEVWHFDGAAWSSVATGLADGAPGLGALWGSGSKDVYAVSRVGALVLHWNGTGWSQNRASAGFRSLSGVGGSGSGDVWLVGSDGVIVHKGK